MKNLLLTLAEWWQSLWSKTEKSREVPASTEVQEAVAAASKLVERYCDLLQSPSPSLMFRPETDLPVTKEEMKKAILIDAMGARAIGLWTEQDRELYKVCYMHLARYVAPEIAPLLARVESLLHDFNSRSRQRGAITDDMLRRLREEEGFSVWQSAISRHAKEVEQLALEFDQNWSFASQQKNTESAIYSSLRRGVQTSALYRFWQAERQQQIPTKRVRRLVVLFGLLPVVVMIDTCSHLSSKSKQGKAKYSPPTRV